jgi:hypothetical protein
MIESIFPAYFEWWHIPIIFLAGLIGEAYGSLIGGGSIVMQSIQMFLGVPIQSAIATDNAAALGTEAGILSETHKKVKENKRLIFWMFLPIALGGIIGTYFLLTISTVVIKYLMITAVLYLLFHSYFLKNKIKSKSLNKWKYVLLFAFLFLIGLYNNFIGIGEGTFSKIALMLVLGLTFVESHGLKTVAMVPIRIYSLIVTGIVGIIVWPYLITFWISNFIAGKYSTRFVKKVPDKYLKTSLTVISLVFVLYLLIFS